MVEIHGEARSHNLSDLQAISDKIKGTFEGAVTEQGGKHQVTVQRVYGIPCAVLGIGTQKIHTTEEYIKIDDLYKTTELAIELIRHTGDQKIT